MLRKSTRTHSGAQETGQKISDPNTLHDRMLPKAENVSYNCLLSMDLSKFLMKMLPWPDLRSAGSRCDHIMRMGLPFSEVLHFFVSQLFQAKFKKRIWRSFWS